MTRLRPATYSFRVRVFGCCSHGSLVSSRSLKLCPNRIWCDLKNCSSKTWVIQYSALTNSVCLKKFNYSVMILRISTYPSPSLKNIQNLQIFLISKCNCWTQNASVRGSWRLPVSTSHVLHTCKLHTGPWLTSTLMEMPQHHARTYVFSSESRWVYRHFICSVNVTTGFLLSIILHSSIRVK